MTDVATRVDTAAPQEVTPARPGFFGRIVLFIRQVLDEVRKVVRPTRDELLQYTAVVVAFIVFVMLFVVVLDQVFQRLVNWVFGSNA